jgi:hypothetical protein
MITILMLIDKMIENHQHSIMTIEDTAKGLTARQGTIPGTVLSKV